MQLPKMLLVRQKFSDLRLEEIPGTSRQQMDSQPFADSLPAGSRIAIGVGSRGISNLPAIVRSVVDYWKDQHMKPFIFPAMGSHGGATAGGQKDILAKHGITEATMNCLIESSMDVVSMGRTSEDYKTYMSKIAYQSDGVFLINRVNRHTDFSGPIESGLCKMAAIGMGNQVGAENYHRIAFGGSAELGDVITSAARRIFTSGKVIGGLAILEDANNQTAKLRAIPAKQIEKIEQELLTQVKSWKGNIPVHELDVLVVDEIGKNISGPGMDPKVVNRSSTTGAYNPLKPPIAPWIGRIYVRSLHPDSGGNAMGIGMADVIHDQIITAMNEAVTAVNAVTAQIPHVARVPIHYATDHKCIEEVVTMTAHPEDPKIGWILNSKSLGLLRLSENMRKEIEANSKLEIIGEPEAFQFNGRGQLISSTLRL